MPSSTSQGNALNVVTWRCPRCKQKMTTKLGSKLVIYKGRRTHICANCVTERDAKRIEQATQSEQF